MSKRRTSVRVTPKALRQAAPAFVRQLGEAHWEIRIEREMKTPNRSAFPWQRKVEREAWVAALEAGARNYAGVMSQAGLAVVKRSLSLFVPAGVKERRRLIVTRLVPKKARFIRDDDNLSYAVKQLRDAMKICGLLYDDKREWLEAPLAPVQAVSDDGKFWVVIEIQRVPPLGPVARTRKPRGVPATTGGSV